jgi:hypothetical protein
MKHLWNKADAPPDGQAGKWSRNVIAVSNLGTVYSPVAFFHAEQAGEEGRWSRPRGMLTGEVFAWWIDYPR